MKTAQRMVDEAAKAAGYAIKGYHGTDAYESFTVFKKGKFGLLGPGIYFSEDESYAKRYAQKSGYAGRVYSSYLRTQNPLVVTSENPAVEILGEKVAKSREEKQASPSYWITSADIKKLQSKGYDGIVWEYGGNREFSVWNPEQIKSADPVTYDNAGNVIPLSKRFDSTKTDIRYSLPLEDLTPAEEQAQEQHQRDIPRKRDDKSKTEKKLKAIFSTKGSYEMLRSVYGLKDLSSKNIHEMCNQLWRGMSSCVSADEKAALAENTADYILKMQKKCTKVFDK